MSPELIQDSGYNENTDVWSLGCIIYELCELNYPFRNKKEKMSLMDLFENITKCNYKPIPSRYSQDLTQPSNQEHDRRVSIKALVIRTSLSIGQ